MSHKGLISIQPATVATDASAGALTAASPFLLSWRNRYWLSPMSILVCSSLRPSTPIEEVDVVMAIHPNKIRLMTTSPYCLNHQGHMGL